jgi:hypothetical protein
MDSIRNPKLVDVEISGIEVIRSWPAGEEAYARSPNADPGLVQRLPTSLVSDFPPVQTFIAGELRSVFKSEFDAEFRSVFVGQRPVRAFVHLKRFDVPSVARRVFLGGAAVIEAEVDLRDAKTGASVLYYSGDSSTKLLFGGLSAPVAAAIAGIRDVRSFTTFCCNTTSGSCAALSPEALLTRSSQTARGRSACA